MAPPFLWDQSHAGLVHVDEHARALRRVPALQPVAPAPNRLRLVFRIGETRGRENGTGFVKNDDRFPGSILGPRLLGAYRRS